jgi:hypothetical protein
MFYLKAITIAGIIQLARADIMVGDGADGLRFVHPQLPAAVGDSMYSIHSHVPVPDRTLKHRHLDQNISLSLLYFCCSD